MATPTPQAVDLPHIDEPLTFVNATNQSGVIAIVTGFSLGIILLSTVVRLYARHCSGLLRADDVAFYVAVLFALSQTGLVFWLVSQGLGKAVELLSQEELKLLQRGEVASTLLYLVVLFLSKASCALMFLCLTPYKTQKRIAWFLFALSFVWLVTSLIVEGLLCHKFAQHCYRFFTRWLYISIFDGIIELALILTSIFIVWRRQMSLRAKFTVFGAFACRLPNVGCTIVRLIFLHETLIPATSAYWTARVQSITQIAVGYTVTACVIPYLRPLMQAYENPDGSLRRSSTVPSFKLSEISSQRSRNASAVARSGTSTVASKTSRKNSSMEDIQYASMSLDDAILMRPHSVQDVALPGSVSTRDWSTRHEHRSSFAGPSKPDVLDMEVGSNQRRSLPSSLPGGVVARSAWDDRDGFDTTDFA
ncbi:hypothetical protein BKA66DRAFT_570710 [Pyrenochaeta sp. MPI-SDFR-AT-0127]|nr:hypothetical protein BKA66DRAFT_570710 [Pyrenochaeta sp. MPI-SDFR-AT-0127]